MVFGQQGGKESYAKNGGGAKDDGKVLMQVRARKVKQAGQRNPGDDGDACQTAYEGASAANGARQDAQHEEAEHAAGENARQYPPGIDNALHAQHGNGRQGTEDTDHDT